MRSSFFWKTFLSAGSLLLAAPILLFAHGDHAHGEIGRKELNALYSTYLEIQNALSKDDLKTAQQTGRVFLKEPHKFPAELSHSVKSKDILEDFKILNRAKDIKAYRKAFQGFSGRMVMLMSEAENAGDAPVLIYHCPMVDGNKGADWLQSTDGVENPYFGASMFACGGLKKTLHAKDEGADGKSDAAHEGHH